MNHVTLTRSPNAEICSSDLRDNRRFATPVSAYSRGWEDSRYNGQYCNTFADGAAQNQYKMGFDDGKERV